jgi:CAAX amino terminal protease family.
LLFLFIIGGTLLALIFQSFTTNLLIIYIIQFIPTIIYIIVQSNNIANRSTNPFPDNISQKIKKIPISERQIGDINPILFLLIIALLTLSIGILLDPLTSIFKLPEFLKKAFELSLSSIYGIISIVVAAPICEEFLMRGIIERGIIINDNPKRAIIISAILFGIIHMNPWQAIPAIIMGLFLGWIYYRTHSLLSVIFIHFINNGSSTLIYLLNPSIGLDTTLKEIIPLNIYLLLYVFCIIITILLLVFLNKKLPTNIFEKYKNHE